MAMEDKEKTAFQTLDGLFCYTMMAFGLHNLGATYQMMVNKLFKDILGITLETYVDDMVVKSKYKHMYSKDLAMCFEIMDKFNLKLNPKKCAFVV